MTFNGEIVAFVNLWLTDKKSEATIDLMRHISDAPPGLMDFLFTEPILYFKAEGFRTFSLGNAPLSGLEGRRTFKNKFNPDWQPVYIALPPKTNVVGVAKDIATLIGGGLKNTLKSKKE